MREGEWEGEEGGRGRREEGGEGREREGERERQNLAGCNAQKGVAFASHLQTRLNEKVTWCVTQLTSSTGTVHSSNG